MNRGRRLRELAIGAALTAGSVVLVLGALEIGLRLAGGRHGDWYAAGPERLRFLASHVQRNEDGFRDRDFARERRPGTARILAAGDSFTFGDGIERVEDTWPKVLESRLRARGLAVEVFNLGVPGTNTAFQRQLLRSRLEEFRPDRVVVGFVPNDPEPPGANRDAVPRRLFLPLLPWRPLDTALTRGSYAYAWLRGKTNQLLEAAGRKETYGAYVKSLYRPGPEWNAFVEEANGLVADAASRNVPVTVALFPLFHDLEHDPLSAEVTLAGEIFRRAGADVVDLRTAYAGIPTSRLCIAATDAHPNVLAHAIAGETIATRLEKSLGDPRASD